MTTFASILKKSNKIREEALRGHNHQLVLLGKLKLNKRKAQHENDKNLLEKLKMEEMILVQRANRFKERLLVLEDLGLL